MDIFFTEIYTYLVFRGDQSANGQMIVIVSSWNTLTKSATLLPKYTTLPSHFAPPPLGFESATVQSSYMRSRLLGELKLGGEHVPAQL